MIGEEMVELHERLATQGERLAKLETAVAAIAEACGAFGGLREDIHAIRASFDHMEKRLDTGSRAFDRFDQDGRGLDKRMVALEIKMSALEVAISGDAKTPSLRAEISDLRDSRAAATGAYRAGAVIARSGYALSMALIALAAFMAGHLAWH